MRLGRRRCRGTIRLMKSKPPGVNKFLLGLLVTGVIFATVVVFATSIRPLMIAYSQSYASGVAVRLINTAVSEHFAKSDLRYDDLIILQKNESGNIIAVQADVVGINKLKSEITLSMQKVVSQKQEGEVHIPLGSILKNDLLAGIGPRIPVKVNPLGFTNIDIESVFSSAGINQTKHQIFLTAEIRIMIYMPSIQKSAKVSTKIPIAETIIVGEIPHTYTNIEGTEKSAQDIMIDILPE